MQISITILCPDCQSSRVKRNGKKSTKKQNYLCKDCGRQFIGDHALSYKGCHSRLTQKILLMLVRGIGIRDIAALNKIRDRVKLTPVTTTNKDELRKAIWHERRLELAFEHDRWFDLVRTGEAEAVMQAHGKPFVKGKHELFPIPNQQLIELPDLGQNPNW